MELVFAGLLLLHNVRVGGSSVVGVTYGVIPFEEDYTPSLVSCGKIVACLVKFNS